MTKGHPPLNPREELEKEFMNSWLDQEKALEDSKQREAEERRLKEDLLANIKSAYEHLIKSGMPEKEALSILSLKEVP